MNTPDLRFMHAIARGGHSHGTATSIGIWHVAYRRWPFGSEAGLRMVTATTTLRSLSRSLHRVGQPTSVSGRFWMMRLYNGPTAVLSADEYMCGMELFADPAEVAGTHDLAADRVGHIPTPETAPAKKHTVQIRFDETLHAADTGFGLEAVRAKVVWHSNGHHILRFTHQMPTGWPDPANPEVPERAISQRAGRVQRLQPNASIHFALPWLRQHHYRHIAADITALDQVVSAFKAAT